MTEVHFKDIGKSFENEHYSTKEMFLEIMDYMKKIKNAGLEEDRAKTEESEEEEEEGMTGARNHDMAKRQESDCR
eukprot:9333399-Heterocapsa_arctica.AAC.1